MKNKLIYKGTYVYKGVNSVIKIAYDFHLFKFGFRPLIKMIQIIHHYVPLPQFNLPKIFYGNGSQT